MDARYECKEILTEEIMKYLQEYNYVLADQLAERILNTMKKRGWSCHKDMYMGSNL